MCCESLSLKFGIDIYPVAKVIRSNLSGYVCHTHLQVGMEQTPTLRANNFVSFLYVISQTFKVVRSMLQKFNSEFSEWHFNYSMRSTPDLKVKCSASGYGIEWEWALLIYSWFCIVKLSEFYSLHVKLGQSRDVCYKSLSLKFERYISPPGWAVRCTWQRHTHLPSGYGAQHLTLTWNNSCSCYFFLYQTFRIHWYML